MARGIWGFFRCLGQAVADEGLSGLLREIPFGESLYKIANGTLERWRRQRQADDQQHALRQEFEAAAQAKLEDFEQQMRELAAEVAPQQPPQVQQALAMYLTLIPARIRQTFSRAEDPSGTTVPGTFLLQRPEDLLPLLPARPPRFQAGDHLPNNPKWRLVQCLGIGGYWPRSSKAAMKRVGNLFEAIVDRDNLRLAFHKALRGKRGRPDAQQFAQALDRRLEEMAAQLQAGAFPLGRFHQFVIHDPKERLITAPCFAERVLHHALMNVCEPHFDRWLIADTYACRTGKGRVAALQRAQQFSGRFPFFLKLDVRKYFESIPHDRLLERLARRFKDRQLLALFQRIVGSFRGSLGRGIPIGSLTSQHLANLYLDSFDRWVKEARQHHGYVRYMDDMAVWADSKATLRDTLTAGSVFLRDELGLEFKPVPYLNRTGHGLDYLGCRVFQRHMVLNRRSRCRFRRRLLNLEARYAAGLLDERALQQRATALVAFARTAGMSSWRFRSRMLHSPTVSGHRARTG